MVIVVGSIDLTKIDKSLLKNDRFIDVTITLWDKTDKYGNNVSIVHSQTKEERDDPTKKTQYFGNAKTVWTDNLITLAEKKEPDVSNATQNASRNLEPSNDLDF